MQLEKICSPTLALIAPLPLVADSQAEGEPTSIFDTITFDLSILLISPVEQRRRSFLTFDSEDLLVLLRSSYASAQVILRPRNLEYISFLQRV